MAVADDGVAAADAPNENEGLLVVVETPKPKPVEGALVAGVAAAEVAVLEAPKPKPVEGVLVAGVVPVEAGVLEAPKLKPVVAGVVVVAAAPNPVAGLEAAVPNPPKPAVPVVDVVPNPPKLGAEVAVEGAGVEEAAKLNPVEAGADVVAPNPPNPPAVDVFVPKPPKPPEVAGALEVVPKAPAEGAAVELPKVNPVVGAAVLLVPNLLFRSLSFNTSLRLPVVPNPKPVVAGLFVLLAPKLKAKQMKFFNCLLYDSFAAITYPFLTKKKRSSL